MEIMTLAVISPSPLHSALSFAEFRRHSRECRQGIRRRCRRDSAVADCCFADEVCRRFARQQDESESQSRISPSDSGLCSRVSERRRSRRSRIYVSSRMQNIFSAE